MSPKQYVEYIGKKEILVDNQGLKKNTNLLINNKNRWY